MKTIKVGKAKTIFVTREKVVTQNKKEIKYIITLSLYPEIQIQKQQNFDSRGGCHKIFKNEVFLHF